MSKIPSIPEGLEPVWWGIIDIQSLVLSEIGNKKAAIAAYSPSKKSYIFITLVSGSCMSSSN